MEVILRDYRREDKPQVVAVFRDSSESLRQSRGGMHSDEAIDRLLKMKDAELMLLLAAGTKLIVAEVKETGEIIGTGGLSSGPVDRIVGSVYSTTHYVKSNFQRGKAGVGVGSLLRTETLARAAKIGCRKMYGFSNPEAVGFHTKFGARFFPLHDREYLKPPIRLKYYEIVLRPSWWNILRIEPFVFTLNEFVILLYALKLLIFGMPKMKAKPRTSQS